MSKQAPYESSDLEENKYTLLSVYYNKPVNSAFKGVMDIAISLITYRIIEHEGFQPTRSHRIVNAVISINLMNGKCTIDYDKAQGIPQLEKALRKEANEHIRSLYNEAEFIEVLDVEFIDEHNKCIKALEENKHHIS